MLVKSICSSVQFQQLKLLTMGVSNNKYINNYAGYAVADIMNLSPPFLQDY